MRVVDCLASEHILSAAATLAPVQVAVANDLVHQLFVYSGIIKVELLSLLFWLAKIAVRQKGCLGDFSYEAPPLEA